MVHDHDPVAQALRLLDVVGDEHDGRAPLPDPPHHLPGLAACAGVQVLGELVEEHDLGPSHQGQGEQPLALAARQPGERPPQQPAQVPLLGQLADRAGVGVQGREQAQGLGHPHPRRQRRVLE